MRALVYNGAGRTSVEDRPRPVIGTSTDVIVRVTNTTICGSDLRIMRGDGPVARGRILGSEGTGTIEQVGDSVSNFRVGDYVLISGHTRCGKCTSCKNGEAVRCEKGGWILGRAIDGTCAEYVLVPFADHSLFLVPIGGDDNARGRWTANFPEGLASGVLCGPDERIDTAPIIFGGSVGLGPLLAVMQYYRTVVRPILHTNGQRYPDVRTRIS